MQFSQNFLDIIQIPLQSKNNRLGSNWGPGCTLLVRQFFLMSCFLLAEKWANYYRHFSGGSVPFLMGNPRSVTVRDWPCVIVWPTNIFSWNYFLPLAVDLVQIAKHMVNHSVFSICVISLVIFSIALSFCLSAFFATLTNIAREDNTSLVSRSKSSNCRGQG